MKTLEITLELLPSSAVIPSLVRWAQKEHDKQLTAWGDQTP